MSDDKREPWQARQESRATRRAALAEDRQRARAVKPRQRVAAIIPWSRYLVPGSCLLGRVGSLGCLGSVLDHVPGCCRRSWFRDTATWSRVGGRPSVGRAVRGRPVPGIAPRHPGTADASSGGDLLPDHQRWVAQRRDLRGEATSSATAEWPYPGKVWRCPGSDSNPQAPKGSGF